MDSLGGPTGESWIPSNGPLDRDFGRFGRKPPAERSARGMLTRAAGASVLVGLLLNAARIWWSVAAAIAVFVVTLMMYVAAAVRYMHRHPGHS